MAQIHWKTAVSGDFATTADWSTGAVPGPSDDAILDASGSPYTVTASTSQEVGSIQTATTATLAIAGGIFSTLGGTGSGANAGAITIDDKAAFEAGHTIDNAGVISIASTGDNTDFIVSAANATLDGGGTVSLAGKARIYGVGSASLTNVDNTISGAGFIGLGALTLVNEAMGVIDATGDLVVGTGAAGLTNTGLIEATKGGTLVLAGSTIGDSGGGQIVAAAGGRVDLQGVHVEGGVVNAEGTGVIATNTTGSVLDGSASAITLSGAVRVLNATNLTVEGTINSSGSIDLYASGSNTDLIVAVGGATLSSGQVNLSNSSRNRIYGAASSATLVNDARIAGAGLIGDGKLTLVNDAQGVINGTGSAPLVIDTGSTPIQNNGHIEATGSGGVTIKSDVSGPGALEAIGGALTVLGNVTGGTDVINGGVLDFKGTNSGTIYFTGSTGEVIDGVSGTVHGFSSYGGTKIDLTSLPYIAGDVSYVVNPDNPNLGILYLDKSDPQHSRSIQLTGNFQASTFATKNDGKGGTLIEDSRNIGFYTGHGDTPPSITPPNVPASTPYTLSGPYTLTAGGILYFTSAPGITQNGVGLLTNSGLIVVIPGAGASSATGIVDGMENPTPHSFVNTGSGVLSVLASSGGDAYGYDSGSNPVAIENAGVIQAVAPSGNAFGSVDYGGYYGAKFTNDSTGLVAVWASRVGVGLDYGQTGVAFDNAGVISVTAGSAIGVFGSNSFTNSGTIIARDIKNDGGSIAVDADSEANLYGGSGAYTNTGSIIGDTAFLFDTSGVSPPQSANITISNSGRMVGTVNLSANAMSSTVKNAGSIKGRLLFGSGANTYDGASGTQSGGIYLGAGANTVNLGNDGESVFGDQTGGSDTIKGGAGNDFIQLSGGNNTIDGGGGVNTLSFAGAANGASVNLATGVATCNGTDQISHITRVIGSTAFDNTLIAGATGAELVAGNAQDRLIGGTGNDTLVAGLGGDVATGGGGANLFVYSTGDHDLIINDYRRNGDADTLHIYGYSKAESITQSGSDTIITLSKTDMIDLRNTSAGSLDLASIVYLPNGHFVPPSSSSLPPPGSQRATSAAVTAAAHPHAFISAMATLPQRMAALQSNAWGFEDRSHLVLAARP